LRDCIAFCKKLKPHDIIVRERGEKSKITNINDGFNFLSQNVRKYRGKLIIRPSKEAVQSLKDKIKKIIEENRGIPAHALIRILYLNHFTDQRITKNGTENHRLYRIGYVPIRYHVKVKAEANPFLPEFDQYFVNRKKRREDLAKECK